MNAPILKKTPILLSDNERNVLLGHARSAIEAQLNPSNRVKRPSEVTPRMKEKRGCFVTLHKKGQLRGCIGTIEPQRTLLANIEENALNAAFKDPRFPELKAAELPLIQIEISVLSVPRTLTHRNPNELLHKLEPQNHGVILSKDWHSATFLPQVWQQLPDKKKFLEHLCLKAGLPSDGWMNPEIGVKVYTVEHFSERDTI